MHLDSTGRTSQGFQASDVKAFNRALVTLRRAGYATYRRVARDWQCPDLRRTKYIGVHAPDACHLLHRLDWAGDAAAIVKAFTDEGLYAQHGMLRVAGRPADESDCIYVRVR